MIRPEETLRAALRAGASLLALALMLLARGLLLVAAKLTEEDHEVEPPLPEWDEEAVPPLPWV